MQLTQFTDYALRTLIYLAQHQDRRCTAKEISSFFNISHNHMIKVVHHLSKCNFIVSIKGKNGGLLLQEDVKSLDLATIIKALEPNFNIAECFNSLKNNCIITPQCKLKNVLNKALSSFMRELANYTLSDILINRDLSTGFMDKVKKDSSL
ncbi:Rrf2 family transcriptional regulator [Fangia hongkongensis]|uniref:Rrf2 family transcriptional regulator n=1 Tax=Fangia hongkongensis TaxID=270495 RepID=UPI0003751654|nr:Rrf2 family transcriptional regulator [Fangia hongkongensis]MBK2125261.1 Rrf2 family transcriptional regulator [Fangia hongkongensis]